MYEAISAGHIALDITPQFFPDADQAAGVFIPGRLIRTGKCIFSLGGSVGNTGVALAKLGVRAALAGKVGGDDMGKMTLNILQETGIDTQAFCVDPAGDSSYTVVLSPVGMDRIFLHNAGANDSFCAGDVDFDALRGAKLFHLGYPTAMRRMAEDGGAALVEILQRARESGMTTSLDFSYPDAEMVRFNWREIFSNALPHADMVFPSFEELMMMLHPRAYQRMQAQDSDVLRALQVDRLSELGQELIKMGAAVAAIKCGTRGYYLRTADESRLNAMGAPLIGNLKGWANREYFTHIFQVEEVKSATGAGDTSIAGFLAAYLRGFSPAACLDAACAVGAVCVTDYSGTGAIGPLDEVLQKMQAGWEKRPYDGCESTRFRYDPQLKLLVGQCAGK